MSDQAGHLSLSDEAVLTAGGEIFVCPYNEINEYFLELHSLDVAFLFVFSIALCELIFCSWRGFSPCCKHKFHLQLEEEHMPFWPFLISNKLANPAAAGTPIR